MRIEAEKIDHGILAAILDGSATGLVLLDGSGRVVYANGTAREWGMLAEQDSSSELRLAEFIASELRDARNNGDTVHLETSVDSGDGVLQVLVIGRPLRLGSIEGAYLLEISNISTISRRELSLRRLVLRDTLTGVASRRHFLDLGEEALADALQTGTALTVGMLDIDRFKQVNDLYGHSVGDLVLSVVAACCDAQLRRNDVIGRLGGDEFGLIMPATSLSIAMGVADRLRAKVVEAMRDEPVRNINVTVSIGLTEILSDDDTFEVLLTRADSALYGAKRAGRNRTERRSETGPFRPA
ncbi:MAG: GGDEF domain-containing protein [Geminicoccaceae bacterium]